MKNFVGTVLTDLLKQYPASSITVLVRKPEQQQMFTNLDVNVVLGDVTDAAKLKSLALEHDVVVNFAVAFGGDEPSIQALVDGLEERARNTQTKPVLLHAGGSGTVMYGSGGEAGTDVWTVIYPIVSCTYVTSETDFLQDEQYDRWSSLPDTAFFYGGYKM
jgi:nucleoside-diphosphate-sugar epimerase